MGNLSVIIMDALQTKTYVMELITVMMVLMRPLRCVTVSGTFILESYVFF